MGDIENDKGELININKETLDEINKDYQNFINNKLIHIKTIKDFQQKLNEVRIEVIHLRNVGHEKGMASRETMILEERKTLQEEFENNFDELSKEIKATKTSFANLNKELSAAISKQLLS